MQRKPGFPVANCCSIKMPEGPYIAEPAAAPGDDEAELLQRRQRLVNFAHTQWGFNNWSWAVTKQELDFVDFANGKYCAGVVTFVSVSVKSLDIRRENIGYATSAAPSKGLAIYKSRKCGVTNALRETLLSFGGGVAAELTELLEAPRSDVGAAPPADPPTENNQNVANKPAEPKNLPIKKEFIRKDYAENSNPPVTSLPKATPQLVPPVVVNAAPPAARAPAPPAAPLARPNYYSARGITEYTKGKLDEDESSDEEKNGSDSNQPKDVPKQFYPGNFVLLKSDVKWDGDTLVSKLDELNLWKICGKVLLQKFIPMEANGKVLHKYTCVYTRWNVDNRDNYYSVTEILDQDPRTDSKEICVALDLNDLFKDTPKAPEVPGLEAVRTSEEPRTLKAARAPEASRAQEVPRPLEEEDARAERKRRQRLAQEEFRLKQQLKQGAHSASVEKQELHKDSSTFDTLLMAIQTQDIKVEQTGGVGADAEAGAGKRKSPTQGAGPSKRRGSARSTD